jgi:hypothetical protein
VLTANSITFNNVVAQPITASTPFEQLVQGGQAQPQPQPQPQQQQQTAAGTLATTKPGTILLTTFPNGTSKAQFANGTTVQVLNGVGYLVLDPTASAAGASASASSPVSNTVVNRFYQAIAIAIGITINATDNAPPQLNTTQSGGPDQDCLFDPSLSKCTPGPEGCPEGFGTNENGQCFPLGGCPDGYHSVEDDESGTCYPDSTPCPDGQVRSDEGNFCVVPRLEPIAPLDCGPGFALNPTTEQCEAVESTPVEPEPEPEPEPESEPEPEPDNGSNDGESGGDDSNDGDSGGGDA